MAIKKGIEVGDVIWKYKDTVQAWRYDRQTGRQHQTTMERFIVLRLYSRRARTNGATLPIHMKPFMQSLNIRTIDYTGYAESTPSKFIAVGVQAELVRNEEAWNQIRVPEQVEKWYGRMNNLLFSTTILTQDTIKASIELVASCKESIEAPINEPTEEEWPEEPEFHSYQNRRTNYYINMPTW